MRKYRKLYIIIVVAYAALLVVSRIYSVSSFLVDIVYLFSWIVLLFLEIRKQYHVKKNDKKEEIDYFPIILIFLMMVICIINMCNYQSGQNIVKCICILMQIEIIRLSIKNKMMFHTMQLHHFIIFSINYQAHSRKCIFLFVITEG